MGSVIQQHKMTNPAMGWGVRTLPDGSKCIELMPFVRAEQVQYTTVTSIICKFCGSADVVKDGPRNGVQYYWCKACKRKFAGNNALPGMRMPPDRIASAVNLFYEGLSLDEIRRTIEHDYGVKPSDSTVYEWVMRFTDVAVRKERGHKAHTGTTWAADETVLNVAGSRTKEGSDNTIWFWDVMDEKTRFLLASHMSQTRTILDAESLFNQARERAVAAPRYIVTDKLSAYIDGIERVFGADAQHIQSQGMTTDTHNNLIERFHGTLKQRTKVMRGLKSKETGQILLAGWLVHYNYFRPHEGLRGKTPAEAARVNFPYRSWREVVEDGYHPVIISPST